MASRKAKHLVIVESPTKARTLSQYLGSDYIVESSIGHVRDLPKRTLGVDEETFEPTYAALPDKKKTLTELKKAAKDAGNEVQVPFSPGRTDASQELTDAASFAALEPTADGFRNYAGDDSYRRPEVELVDRANLLNLAAANGCSRLLPGRTQQDVAGRVKQVDDAVDQGGTVEEVQRPDRPGLDSTRPPPEAKRARRCRAQRSRMRSRLSPPRRAQPPAPLRVPVPAPVGGFRTWVLRTALRWAGDPRR